MQAFHSASRAGRCFIALSFALILGRGWIKTGWSAEEVWDNPPFSMTSEALSSAVLAIPVSAGSDYMILLDESKYVFEDDGSYTHSLYRVFRVVTPAGAKSWTTVQFSWRIWREEKPQIRARVITPDGVAHMLDPKTIAEAPMDDEQPDLFNDLRIVRAPLPAIQAGSIVEEQIVVTGKKSILCNGIVQSDYLGNFVPTNRARIVIDAPLSLPIQYQSRLMDAAKIRRLEEGSRFKLIVEDGPLEAFKTPELFLPPDIPRWPELVFSSGKSWQDVANHYNQIVERQIRMDEVQSFVSRANIVGKNRKDTITALLALIQDEVRYTGVEFGEASLVPRNPAETLRRKYGDCKDKAALLIAILRTVGIPAHLALLNTSRQHETLPNLPGLGQFNHAIVFVPGSPDIWIDVTSEYTRVGQLPTSDEGRLALVVRPETVELVKTPESVSVDNLEIETREFFLQEFGPARIIETTETFGSIEAIYRNYYAYLDPKEAEQQFREYGQEKYLAKEQSHGTFSVPRDLSVPFSIRIEMPKAGRAVTDRAEAVVAIIISDIGSRLSYLDYEEEELSEDVGENGDDKKVNKRVSELLLQEAFVTEWRYKIVPPPGFNLRGLPESTRAEIGPALLTREYSTSADGLITASFRLDTRKRRLTPKEADDLVFRLKELRNEEPILIYFDQVGESLLQEGKIREALDEFRRLSSLHAGDALHYSQMARALLAAGLGEAARQEARRAVQMDPNSAAAFETLGEVLENDLIGRRLTIGMDRDGAIAARRRSVELEPDNVYNKISLAILLEHDRRGDRYKSTNELKEAIEIYRSLGSKLEETGMEHNLHIARIWAGQFEDLKKDLRKPGESKEKTALMLVAIAATEGPAAAIRRAVALESAEDARRDAFRSAGNTLIQLRMYPQGAELIKAGARGTSTAAEELSRAAMFAKVRRKEDVKHNDSEPQSALYRFMELLLNPEIQKEDLANLFSRFSGDKDNIKEGVESLQRLGVIMRAGLAQSGVPIEVIADIMFSYLEFHIEGDDSIGYEIKTEIPGSQSETLFVVKEEDRYVIIGTDGGFEDVGKLVLELVKAGEAKRARVWLDRARESLTPAGGDDPLSGHAFSRLWTKGQEAIPDQMRLAAAALMSKSDRSGISIPILMGAQNTSATGPLRTAIDLALYQAFWFSERWEDAHSVALRLSAASPMSRTAFIALSLSQLRTKRWKECEQSANDRLKTRPNDLDALRSLLSLAELKSDWATAANISDRIAASGKAEAEDYNTQAWNTLFAGSVDEAALQKAEKATMLSQNRDYNSLHTLASIQAELGNTTEAREILLHAMQAKGLVEPDASCWYVFARIAEQFMQREAALNAYAKVTASDAADISPNDVFNLAQKRIKILQSLGK